MLIIIILQNITERLTNVENIKYFLVQVAELRQRDQYYCN